jgi:hypothetical protein
VQGAGNNYKKEIKREGKKELNKGRKEEGKNGIKGVRIKKN